MPTGPYLVSSIAPITGADAGFRVRGTPVAYPGFQRGGCLRSGPIRKVGRGGGGGAVHFRSDIRKVRGGWEGGGAIRFRSDTKIGGGAIRFGSDTKSGGGGGIPLQVRYLCLAHRSYIHIPTYVLPRYTAYARANELKKYMPAKVNLL